MTLYTTNPKAAVDYLNKYSNQKAQEMLARWKQLAVYLIVKYNDMTVRPEKDGKFLRTKTGLGARVSRPGYPQSFAREYIKQTQGKYVKP